MNAAIAPLRATTLRWMPRLIWFLLGRRQCVFSGTRKLGYHAGPRRGPFTGQVRRSCALHEVIE